MKKKSGLRRFLIVWTFLCMVMLGGITTQKVSAGEMVTIGPDVDLTSAVNAAFKKGNSVQLISGESYELTGTIKAKSGTSIDATGATIYGTGCLIDSPFHDDYDETKQYTQLTDFRVTGGTWIYAGGESGLKHSAIKMAHASNLVFEDMVMRYCSYENHSIEFVGCKDVLVQNCNISAMGPTKDNSVEEQIQIDIAASKTAPFLPEEAVDGTTCHNVQILGNTVKGSRALVVNFPSQSADKKYAGNAHTNITIKGNILVGVCTEALAVYNTTSAVIEDNTCISNAVRVGTSRSESSFSGIHFRIQKAITDGEDMDQRKVVIQRNECRGQFFGMKIGSYTPEKGKEFKDIQSISVKNNICSTSKADTANAIKIDSAIKGVVKLSGNELRSEVPELSVDFAPVEIVKVQELVVSGSYTKIAPKKKVQLKVKVYPSDASYKAVTWKISNSKYASVNSSGKVTLKSAAKGKTFYVYAVAKDGSKVKSNKYKIKGMKGIVKKITLSGSKTVTAGKSITIKKKISASSGANKTLSWKVNNKKYATITSKGVLTAAEDAAGKKVKVTATATDGSGKKATRTITIKAEE